MRHYLLLTLLIASPLRANDTIDFFKDALRILAGNPQNCPVLVSRMALIATDAVILSRAGSSEYLAGDVMRTAMSNFLNGMAPGRINGGMEEVLERLQQKKAVTNCEIATSMAGSLGMLGLQALQDAGTALKMLLLATAVLRRHGDAGVWKHWLGHAVYKKSFRTTPAPAENNCIICLEGGGQWVKPCTEHVFHKECIDGWANKSHTCPTCRGALIGEEILRPLHEIARKIAFDPAHSPTLLMAAGFAYAGLAVYAKRAIKRGRWFVEGVRKYRQFKEIERQEAQGLWQRMRRRLKITA